MGSDITPSNYNSFLWPVYNVEKSMHYIIVQKGSVHYTDYIVQSSAANSLRFIIIFFPKPMEPALLFWWAKAGSLLEPEGGRSKASISAGCLQSVRTDRLFGCQLSSVEVARLMHSYERF